MGFIVAMGGGAIAQEKPYPNKSIRWVVPYPPGGSTDNLARVLATRWGENLKQSVVIDNRGGAGGNIGVEVVAKSTADGYTVGLFDTAFVVNPSLYKKLPFDTLKDFDSVMFVAVGPAVLVVNPTLGVSTIKDLVLKVQSQPGKFAYASAGSGTAIHLAGEMFKSSQKLQITHVPYKGAGPAGTALLSGETDFMFSNVASAINYVKSGKLRALAVTSAKRSPALPDVPTMAEAGFKGQEADTLQGVFVPAGTSKAIVNRIAADIKRLIAQPETAKRVQELGFDIVASTPEEFAAQVKTEVEKWGKVIKASGLKAE